mgnify:CR=1 FL=1
MISKKILLIYNPWRPFKGSLHEVLLNGLKSVGFEVDYLDIENIPQFSNNYLPDKLRNIYERKINQNNDYILVAENKFHNRYFLKQLQKIKQNDKKYDLVLIIKPEEYTSKFIKDASVLGKQVVGYIWDGLRLFLKPNIQKSRKYLNDLYSFDINNIRDLSELKMKFLTNYYIPDDTLLPFEERKTDVFYIGSLAGTLDSQRRDWKLNQLARYLHGNIDINIHISQDFLEKDKKMLTNSSKVKYTTQYLSLFDNLEKTKNAKIVIDICKNHHVGLSFRFFECLNYEVKLITNNKDVTNYDFYHPDNILVVDFDKIDCFGEAIKTFQTKPYQHLPIKLKEKYSLKNWMNFILKTEDFSTYTHPKLHLN